MSFWWLLPAFIVGLGAGLLIGTFIRALAVEMIMYGWNGIFKSQEDKPK